MEKKLKTVFYPKFKKKLLTSTTAKSAKTPGEGKPFFFFWGGGGGGGRKVIPEKLGRGVWPAF